MIYARISNDKDGEGAGVERQEQDCRALCEANGWTVAEVYVENDVSASARSRKPRPLYAEMIHRAQAGEFDAIVAYSNSRLTRRFREFIDLIDLAEQRGVRIVTVVSGEDNLATADGRMVARIKASVDVNEAERISERLTRAKAQAALDGRYRGGMRPYGYDRGEGRGDLVIREDEAQVIREATAGVIAGRTLASMARELNESGLVTSTGNPWTYARLRDVLIRPRNAGLLSRGRPDRGPDGFEIVGTAKWEPIVSEADWHAMYAILSEPSRRQQDGNDTRWLGSGIYVCGRCGGDMRAAPSGGTKARSWQRRYHYRCTSAAHLTIETSRTDQYVLNTVAELLRDPRLVAVMVEPDPLLDEHQAKRKALEARLSSFQAALVDGTLTPIEYRKAADKVQTELAAVQALIDASVQRSTSSSVLSDADPGAAFLAAPLDVQRAVLRTVLRVTVVPAEKKGARWSRDRVRLERPNMGEAVAS